MSSNRTRAAFTLIEMAISVAVLGLVIGSVSMMATASERAFQTSCVRSHLEAQAVAALERAVVDLRIGVSESLAPELDDDEITSEVTYFQALELAGTEIELGPQRRLALELETGELDDGADNNGNGLVDEGRLVLTVNLGTADEERRVLTRWVRELFEGEEPNNIDDNANGLIDEPGFFLQKSGQALSVYLTLERRDSDGRPLCRTARSSAKIRN